MTTNTKQASPSFNPRAFYWSAIVSTLLALITHGYLLNDHYELRFGDATGRSLCNINDLFNCAAVSASRYSELLGVPMALWGMAANLAFLGLLLWYPLVEEDDKKTARTNLFIVSAVIALASIVMGFISSIVLARYCPFCIVAYVLSFISFGSIWMLHRSSVTSSSLLRTRAFRFMDLKPVIILAAAGFIGSFIANQQIVKSFNGNNLPQIVNSAIEEWNAMNSVAIDTSTALVMGAPVETAKMVITEFADFRCIHCKIAAPVLKAFVNSHPKTVRLQFMTWPLDGECNTAIPQANGASCLLSRVSHCVQKLSGDAQAWKAHAMIFDHLEKMTNKDAALALIPTLAQSIGADQKALESCADAPETKALIQKQASVGTALNLKGTPTIFVNGKLLPYGQLLPVLTAVHDRIVGQ